jgi:hypothetical protein
MKPRVCSSASVSQICLGPRKRVKRPVLSYQQSSTTTRCELALLLSCSNAELGCAVCCLPQLCHLSCLALPAGNGPLQANIHYTNTSLQAKANQAALPCSHFSDPKNPSKSALPSRSLVREILGAREGTLERFSSTTSSITSSSGSVK